MRNDPRKTERETEIRKKHLCFNCGTQYLPSRQPLCYRCRTSLADDFFINLYFVYALAIVAVIANLYLLFPSTLGTLGDILELKDPRTTDILQWFALSILVLMLLVTYVNFFRIRRIAIHRDNLSFSAFYTGVLLFCFGLVYLLHIPLEASSRAIIAETAIGISIIIGVTLRRYIARLNRIFLSTFVLSVLLLVTVLVRAGLGSGHPGSNWFFQFPGLSVIGLAGLMTSTILLSLRMDLISKTFGYYNLWTLALTLLTVTFALSKTSSGRIAFSNDAIIFATGIATILMIVSLTHYAMKKRIDMRVKNNLEAIKHLIDESYGFIDRGEYFYALNSINTGIELNPLHGVDNPLRKSLLKWTDGASKHPAADDKGIDTFAGRDPFRSLDRDKSRGEGSPDFKGSELIWIKKAELAIVKGDIPKAIEYYRNGIRANPRFSETWLELGNLFASREGISRKARDCYERVLELKAEPIRRWIGDRIPLRYISWLIVSYLFYEISLYRKGMILGSVRDEGLSEGERLYGSRTYTSIFNEGSSPNGPVPEDVPVLKANKEIIKPGRYSPLSTDEDFVLESRRYTGATAILPRGGTLDSYYRLLAEQNIIRQKDEKNEESALPLTKAGPDLDERVEWDELERAITACRGTEQRKGKGGDDGIEIHGSGGKGKKKKKKKLKGEGAIAKKGADTKKRKFSIDDNRKEILRDNEGGEKKVTEERGGDVELLIPEIMDLGEESKGAEKEDEVGIVLEEMAAMKRAGKIEKERGEQKDVMVDKYPHPPPPPEKSPMAEESGVVTPEIAEAIKQKTLEESPLDELMNLLNVGPDEEEKEEL